MTRKILAASLAVLFTVSMVFVGYTNNAEAHDIGYDKEIILCAYEIPGGQTVAADNAVTPGGIVHGDSWTFVQIDSFTHKETHVHFADTEDEVTHDHYDCDDIPEDVSFPGPSIKVDLADRVKITLVNDADNEHVHSLDFHVAKGDEHVNSGPVAPGHVTEWTWEAKSAGTWLYHCAANGLFPVWTHINNGMYGSVVVSGPGNSQETTTEYTVAMADMYVGEATFTGIDIAAFLSGNNDLMVTNGMAFKYTPGIGSDIGDGVHFPLPLNADAVPILVPINEPTRWHIVNPGPNNVLAFHFIAGQIDVRDGTNPSGVKLGNVEFNEETWNVQPGSASVFDVEFPSVGPYVGLTHKLNDVVKGGAFVAIGCDMTGAENGDHPLSAALCVDQDDDSDFDLDDLAFFNDDKLDVLEL